MNTHELYLLYCRALRAGLRMDEIQFDGQIFSFRKRGFAELSDEMVEAYIIGRCIQRFVDAKTLFSSHINAIERSSNHSSLSPLLVICIEWLEVVKDMEEAT